MNANINIIAKGSHSRISRTKLVRNVRAFFTPNRHRVIFVEMIRKVEYSDVRGLLERVFGTDADLYLRRQKSDNKTLNGLVDFAMTNLFDGVTDVDVYSYGDEYGFFAVHNNICRSFGIKKEHRDKKELFWSAIREVVGSDCLFVVWGDNDRAIHFFDSYGGELINSNKDLVLYRFNLN